MKHWCLTLSIASVLLAGCGPHDHATSPAQLGIATPDHPVINPARLEQPSGTPMQVQVPTPAVGRATDAGANDEGGRIEPNE